ncbi:methyltransferase domain-containing protein [bacterium]|nr:methyltransferase domain-containing protein [bacterium]
MRLFKHKTLPDGRVMLNLGCGNRYHKDWTNINLFKYCEAMISYDVLRGIPFPADTFDVVYHSHLLEHVDRDEGATLLRECHRVLKPQGIIRVVVPDLEYLVREYQEGLRLARENGDTKEYDFALLNFLDQMVRNKQGGYLADFLKDPRNYDFMVKKIGKENADHWQKNITSYEDDVKGSPLNRLKKIFPKDLGPDQTGELHKWMYDSYSLKRALKEAGFKDIREMTYNQSNIKDWNEFELDCNPDGSSYKYDSIFMEALK